MEDSTERLGLWLIGAAGNVAATVAVGLAALQRRLVEPVGLITECPPFQSLPLAPLRHIVLGGHEIRRRTVWQTAKELAGISGAFAPHLLKAVRPVLDRIQKNIRPGTTVRTGAAVGRMGNGRVLDSGKSARAIIERIRKDLASFHRRHRLTRVVVINVASTEPRFALATSHRRWSSLDRALIRKKSPLPASSLYAIAAIEQGMPFVNFTPSPAADMPAIRELAVQRRVPIMGNDGKTGETLLKSVLAPMFRERGLRVLSWVGHNILGNQDGLVLDSPSNKAAKLAGKDGVIASILGYTPQTRTSIEFVQSLQDWKTAWDHVHFSGFLGTKMSLQFVWQGCDSILAAPLVLDLARLTAFHQARELAGVMTHLACFFKTPMDVREHDFSAQIAMLHRYVADAHVARTTIGRRGSRKGADTAISD